MSNPETWDFKHLCKAVRSALDDARAGKPINWTGPTTTWNELLANSVGAPDCFDADWMDFHAERDRDPVDVVIMAAIHLGMEQAARLISGERYARPEASDFKHARAESESKDPTKDQTMTEQPYKLRDITPQTDPNIETWLNLLTADPGPPLDWLASAVENKSSRPLFLLGAPSSGKSLLALGVARLWELPAEQTRGRLRFGCFSVDSPLIILDEPTNTESFSLASFTNRIGSVENKHQISRQAAGYRKLIATGNEVEVEVEV